MKNTLFRALLAAGSLIRRNFDKPRHISFKGGSTINLVTDVDQAADRLIRRIIQKEYPSHDFLTEESEPTKRGSPYKWIIDPLDGTTNFAHGYPQVAVSIGLEYSPKIVAPEDRNRGPINIVDGSPPTIRGEDDSEIILGGVYDPFRDELFWAAKGQGAYIRKGRKQKKITPSLTRSLTHSLLLTGFPYDRRENADLYLSYVKAFMHRIQGIRREGAAALDLCWVACGRVDGYWEWRLKPWDCAAGKIILEEAGGRLTDFSGNKFSIYGQQTLATNGRVHREMLQVMDSLPREVSPAPKK